jgi:hypothetical protein
LLAEQMILIQPLSLTIPTPNRMIKTFERIVLVTYSYHKKSPFVKISRGRFLH